MRFTEDDMPRLRKMMMLEIANKRLNVTASS